MTIRRLVELEATVQRREDLLRSIATYLAAVASGVPMSNDSAARVVDKIRRELNPEIGKAAAR